MKKNGDKPQTSDDIRASHMTSPRLQNALRERPAKRPRRSSSQDFPDQALPDKSILRTFTHLGFSVSHPAGTVLFQEGEPADGIYLVQDGQIKLGCSAGPDRSMILRIAQAGEILGLSAMLNECNHEMTAQALTSCELTHIAPKVFMNFVNDFAAAGAHALTALARDHREVFLSARRLALFPRASTRMAQVLIGFSHAGTGKKETASFLLLLTHAELANLIGTTRETVTRVLNELERQKVIARNQALVTILKPAKLEQLAH